MRYYIQPKNYVRNWRTGLGALAPIQTQIQRINFVNKYGEWGYPPPPVVSPVATTPLAATVAPTFVPQACPAWGCGPAPIRWVGSPIASTPGTTTTPPPSTAATAGTPVPPGYNVNSVFIASDGSQWEYSSGSGKWIDVGTPYNLNPSGTPATLSPPADSITTPAALTSSGSIPAGTSTNAPYTDASGNTWVYNPATGAWVLASAATTSPYSSILTFLSDSSLGAAVGIQIPNWITLSALGFVALKLMHGQEKGRR